MKNTTVSSGRSPRIGCAENAAQLTAANKELKKKAHSLRLSDAAAIACSVICAICLCLFCIGGGEAEATAVSASTTSRITHTPPEKAEEWSFWDYFSSLCAGLLGYDEA